MLTKQLFSYSIYLSGILENQKLGLKSILQALIDARPQDEHLFEPVFEILALNLRDIGYMLGDVSRAIEQLPEFKAQKKELFKNNNGLTYATKNDFEWLRIYETNGPAAAIKFRNQLNNNNRQRGAAWNIKRFDKTLSNASQRLHEFADLLKQEGFDKRFKEVGPYEYHIPNSIGIKNFLHFRKLNGELTLDEFIELFDILVTNALKELDIIKQFANGESPDTTWYIEYKRARVEEDGDHYAESLIQFPNF